MFAGLAGHRVAAGAQKPTLTTLKEKAADVGQMTLLFEGGNTGGGEEKRIDHRLVSARQQDIKGTGFYSE